MTAKTVGALPELTFHPMLITDVFDVYRQAPSWLNTNEAKPGPSAYPHVTNSAQRNSVASFIALQDQPPNPGNAITVGIDTQAVAYQPAPFYGGTKVLELRSEHLNEENAQVLVTTLHRAISKFSWGFKASAARLLKTKFMVPVTTRDNGAFVVDWEGMSEVGRALLDQARLSATHVRRTQGAGDDALPELTFAPMFVVNDDATRQAGLFRAHKGKRLTKADRRPGRVPFVTGSRMNNSIRDYASAPPMFPGGWLTLIYNGDGGTGHAKYQPVPFSASDDVIVLEPHSPDASESALLMLVTILTHQCVSKFGFGYKLTLDRLTRQRVMVPVTTDESGDQVPDWEGMTAYGLALRVDVERAVIRDESAEAS